MPLLKNHHTNPHATMIVLNNEAVSAFMTEEESMDANPVAHNLLTRWGATMIGPEPGPDTDDGDSFSPRILKASEARWCLGSWEPVFQR